MAKRVTPRASAQKTPAEPVHVGPNATPAATRAARSIENKTAPAPPPPPATKPARGPVEIKVRATRLGYFDHCRRREGDVFTIHSEQEFSEKWMERVSQRTRESITTGQEDLNRKFDDIKEMRGLPTGVDHDRAATGDDNDPLNQ